MAMISSAAKANAARLGVTIKPVHGGFRLLANGRDPRGKILSANDANFWLGYWGTQGSDLRTWTPPAWVESPLEGSTSKT